MVYQYGVQDTFSSRGNSTFGLSLSGRFMHHMHFVPKALLIPPQSTTDSPPKTELVY